MELIPGIEFDFGGGRVYTIPPLSLGALQRLQCQLDDMQNAAALQPATVTTVVQAAHAALKRNYPQMTFDDVAELVDVGNMYDVIACVLDVSGMRRKELADQKKQQAQLTSMSVGPD
jgi:hypothetical protein